VSPAAAPRPLILGHRGSSALAPENTLAAFKRCIEDGADGFEFDVRLSRDAVPVVIHDASLQRTSGQRLLVSDLTVSELQQIDVGSWFNRQYPERAQASYERQTVPTLDEVIHLTRESQSVLCIEMKPDSARGLELAAKVVGAVQEHSLYERVVVESFDLAATAEVKRLEPKIRTAALFEPSLKHPSSLVRSMKTTEFALKVRADVLALHHSLATKRAVEEAKNAGLAVVVWTVEDAAWVERALKFGIEALIANNPAPLVGARQHLIDGRSA
jgi:glycerophosphoryl diester phosphodiesterase